MNNPKNSLQLAVEAEHESEPAAVVSVEPSIKDVLSARMMDVFSELTFMLGDEAEEPEAKPKSGVKVLHRADKVNVIIEREVKKRKRRLTPTDVKDWRVWAEFNNANRLVDVWFSYKITSKDFVAADYMAKAARDLLGLAGNDKFNWDNPETDNVLFEVVSIILLDLLPDQKWRQSMNDARILSVIRLIKDNSTQARMLGALQDWTKNCFQRS